MEALVVKHTWIFLLFLVSVSAGIFGLVLALKSHKKRKEPFKNTIYVTHLQKEFLELYNKATKERRSQMVNFIEELKQERKGN